MTLNTLDLIVFALFTLFVIAVSLYASRKEESSEDYFLAGRNLAWWTIGLSLIASNISTEHFVGMAGRGFAIGLAIASYEWMAAITLVIVALFFLPKFLKNGIYTIPEFLEYRYGEVPRTLMAILILITYVVVALASVLYSGALALNAIFDINLVLGIWLIGILAGAYTVYGGLKAVVWSDVIQGSTLMIGGLIITLLGFQKIGGLQRFLELSQDKLHTVLPWDHPEMPWIAVFIGGLWIPNLFYWGLNQFISQRTLAAKSLAEGQKGIMLAAFLKLLIPFIIVFPGIMALHLYPNDIPSADQAYPIMIAKILPTGLRGIMLAALFGAVMSSLDSILNSASTIFTIDIYKRYISKTQDQTKLVRIGRISTAILVITGCLYAPILSQFESIFQYLQMIWGFISPGIVASFLFGLMWPKVPAKAATGAMLLGIPVYGFLVLQFPHIAFLHHMAITFLVLCLFITAFTLYKPLKTPRSIKVTTTTVDLTPFRYIKETSLLLVLLTAGLYVLFY